MSASSLPFSRIAMNCLMIAGCVVLPSVPVLAQQSLSSRYKDVRLDFPGAPINFPLTMNNKRELVGYYLDAGYLPHGYLYKDGKFTAVEYLGALSTVAGGINDRGDISGLYVDQQGFQHGYLRTMPEGCDCDGNSWKCQPSYTSLDVPGAAKTQIDFEFGPGLGTGAAGINNRREVVGLYATQDLYSNGFIFTDRRYRIVDNPAASHTTGNGTRLFSINNFGAAAGTYLAQANAALPAINYGFIVEGGAYTTVFVPGSDQGGFGTQANGINDFKIVTGIFSDPAGLFHALLWFRGQSVTVDYPGAGYSEAHAINDRGDMTGSYTSDPTGATIHGWIAYPKL